VALNYNLRDDYDPNELGVKVVDYVVNNNYSKNGKSNPHKSYGYLRTSEFSNMIADFIEKDERSLKLMWLSLKHKIKEYFSKTFNKL
jgi:hypothetical protein